MPKITFLGNWSEQTANTDTSNYLIEANGLKILLDAGPGIVKQLDKAGVDVTSLDLIIVTHCHGDHALGIPYLIFSDYFKRIVVQSKQSALVRMLALPEVHKGLAESLKFFYPFIPANQNYRIEKLDADPSSEKRFEFKGIAIITTPAKHTVPSIAVRFEAEGKGITFSNDTAYEKGVVTLAKGSDLLVHEGMGGTGEGDLLHKVGHSIAEDAGRVAKEANVKKLALCHILPKYGGNKDVLIKEAAREFNGEIVIPKDLEVLGV